MSVSARVRELKIKHETLSQTVEKAQQSPAISDIDIKSLKKQKLRIKEEISRLSSGRTYTPL
jgi:hypothetical protein